MDNPKPSNPKPSNSNSATEGGGGNKKKAPFKRKYPPKRTNNGPGGNGGGGGSNNGGGGGGGNDDDTPKNPRRRRRTKSKSNSNAPPRAVTPPDGDVSMKTNEDEPMKVVNVVSDGKPVQEAGETKHQFSDAPFSTIPNISNESQRALQEVLKYEMMTLVQKATLFEILDGKDVLAKAKTGSGKTTAFLLPTIEHIAKQKAQQPRGKKTISAVILSPTRELTNQIALEAKALTTFHKITTVALIGGTNINADKKRLNGDVDIIVATPGRFQDHLNQNSSNIKERMEGLMCLCLDEADRLLDMGFRKELSRIISTMPKERQTLLFSATLPDSLNEITKVALKPDYEFINTVAEGESNTNVQVLQEYVVCPLESQIATLESILTQHQKEAGADGYKIIVFFNTARTAGFMSELFRAAKYPILEMHSRKSQSYRTKCAKDFTSKNNLIMFSSDVSARGVDYPGVTLIVQVGLTEREQYIHRLGRTARAGRSGQGVILLGEFERFFLTKVLKDLEISEMKPFPLMDPRQSPCMKLVNSIERNKDLVKSAEMAYQSFLGYYNSNLRRVGMDKITLVKMGKEYASSLGLSYVPALMAKTVGKMGLKGTPGLVIARGNK